MYISGIAYSCTTAVAQYSTFLGGRQSPHSGLANLTQMSTIIRNSVANLPRYDL